MREWGRFASAAAAALDLDLADLPRGRDPDADPLWRSAFPVEELALDSVAFASALADRFVTTRNGREATAVRVDPARVAASFGSDRVLRVDGEAPSVWAPLSGFWRARDGWVRTHGNYPHHAARLRLLLGLDDAAPREAIADAISLRGRFDLEDAAASAGAIVAAVRDAAEWEKHPQYAALVETPFVGTARTGDAPPRTWSVGGVSTAPLDGIRVLDLTRVIAGPVATRDLALAGADVLRVDSSQLPEIPWQHLDTGQHKRTTSLDLADVAERRVFDELLQTADVVVTGYRPGALERFGLDVEGLVDAHPGLVVATVSAWGTTGPWAHRRGFDSIVQAATGIAKTEQAASATGAPGALPVQALDHASGHLLAAAILDALHRQRTTGGSYRVSVALARTALEVMAARGDAPALAMPSGAPALPLQSLDVEGGGTLTCAPPPLAFAGAPSHYSSVHRWGSDAPVWLEPGSGGGIAQPHAL